MSRGTGMGYGGGFSWYRVDVTNGTEVVVVAHLWVRIYLFVHIENSAREGFTEEEMELHWGRLPRYMCISFGRTE